MSTDDLDNDQLNQALRRALRGDANDLTLGPPRAGKTQAQQLDELARLALSGDSDDVIQLPEGE